MTKEERLEKQLQLLRTALMEETCPACKVGLASNTICYSWRACLAIKGAEKLTGTETAEAPKTVRAIYNYDDMLAAMHESEGGRPAPTPNCNCAYEGYKKHKPGCNL